MRNEPTTTTRVLRDLLITALEKAIVKTIKLLDSKDPDIFLKAIRQIPKLEVKLSKLKAEEEDEAAALRAPGA